MPPKSPPSYFQLETPTFLPPSANGYLHKIHLVHLPCQSSKQFLPQLLLKRINEEKPLRVKQPKPASRNGCLIFQAPPQKQLITIHRRLLLFLLDRLMMVTNYSIVVGNATGISRERRRSVVSHFACLCLCLYGNSRQMHGLIISMMMNHPRTLMQMS